MKVDINPKKDTYQEAINVINLLYNKTDKLISIINQSKLEDNTTSTSSVSSVSDESVSRKYFCNNPSCKKEITKDVVAFCLRDENKSRFGGKVYCRECQQNIDVGGD